MIFRRVSRTALDFQEPGIPLETWLSETQDAGGAAGGHCLGWIRLGYFTPEVAALPFSLEEG